METAPIRRPRIPRETRLVIVTALLALVALWVLARVRFPDVVRDTGASQVLTPLAARPAFELLSARVAATSSAVASQLVSLELATSSRDGHSSVVGRTPGWRLRDDLVVFHLPEGTSPLLPPASSIVGEHPYLNLAVARIPTPAPAPPAGSWPLELESGARYVFASDPLSTDVVLRPVWLGGLHAVDSPLWSATVYEVPVESDLAPGHLVFSIDGLWLGLIANRHAGLVIVPSGVVARAAEFLVTTGTRTIADLGLEVQAISPQTARATGAATGIIVAWVSTNGAAAGRIVPGDVIEAINGDAVPSIEHWQRALARLGSSTATSLTVRRQHQTVEVTLVPDARKPTDAAPAAPGRRRPLGLAMRQVPDTGAAITGIERDSVGYNAGLEIGDVIVWLGSTQTPSPAQVQRILAASPSGGPIAAGIRRDGRHRVVTFEP